MLRLLAFGGLTLMDGDAPVTGAAAQRSRLALLRSAIAQGHRPTDMGNVSLHEDGDFLSLHSDAAFRELVRPRDGPLELP